MADQTYWSNLASQVRAFEVDRPATQRRQRRQLERAQIPVPDGVMLPAAMRDPAGNAYADLVMPVAAERGEPWLTLLASDDMSARLEKHGLADAEPCAAARPGTRAGVEPDRPAAPDGPLGPRARDRGP